MALAEWIAVGIGIWVVLAVALAWFLGRLIGLGKRRHGALHAHRQQGGPGREQAE